MSVNYTADQLASLSYREIQAIARVIRENTDSPVKLNAKREVLVAFILTNSHCNIPDVSSEDTPITEIPITPTVIEPVNSQDDVSLLDGILGASLDLDMATIDVIEGVRLTDLGLESSESKIDPCLESSESKPDDNLLLLILMCIVCLLSMATVVTFRAYKVLGTLALKLGYLARTGFDAYALPTINRVIVARMMAVS